jgi:hypothetical protein
LLIALFLAQTDAAAVLQLIVLQCRRRTAADDKRAQAL